MNELPTAHIVSVGPRARSIALRCYWWSSGEHTDGEPLWFRVFLRFWAVWSWVRFCWFVRGLPRKVSA